MHRVLLAGCLSLALASAASTQAVAPADDALSPIEVFTGVPPSPATADKLTAKDAAAKADAAKKAEAAKQAAAKAAEHDANNLGQCLRDWDTGTHMTRQEWARTCRRVVAERIRSRRDNQDK